MAAITSVVSWFADEKGIDCSTLDAFAVNIEDDGTIVYPYRTGEKRRSDPTNGGKRKFWFTKGAKPCLWHPMDIPPGDIAFLAEGESDTMRLWRELGGKYPVYGLSGAHAWNREDAEMLAGYQTVYVVLDQDADYNVRAQVDNAWKEIRRDLSGKAKRIHLPAGCKDICEFFDQYDVDTLKLLTKRLGQSRYKPVDFNAPPPPVRWLLEGYIALGDVTLLVGKGGLGKSWLSLGLAVSTLTGTGEFLGMPLRDAGRVLVVDEENPLDIVYSRAKKLGLDPAQHAGQLRYLWNQGIRLDSDPDSLLEEALEFQPTLIVLDSLTRLHGGEENNAGEIARLFNDGIKPLARETGAAVVLIHHHDKAANGPRGSSDIENSADASIEIHEDTQPGHFRLALKKSRRRLGGEELRVAITDVDDRVELVARPPFEPKF